MDIGLEIEELLEAKPRTAPDPSLPDLYVAGTFIEGEVRMKRKELEVSAVRELLDDDIVRLQAAQVDRVNGPKDACPLELRTRHHEVARLMVLGYKQREIAQHLNYAEVTISNLKRGKAFQQLLLFYMDKRNEIVTDPRALMHLQSLQNLNVLQERIEQTEGTPDQVGFSTLSTHTMNMLDRAGFGPSRTEKHEHVFLTEEDMKEIKQVEAEFEVLQENTEATPVGETLPGAQTGETPAEVSRS